ncbi:restriction endonuclease subunit S [Cronobacter dublinensis]|uniref:restriction endonuclease subunit S n=1 Tax=Cronobacter dublinensis TaxID=413497 RepID=UPI0024C38CE1|nr:restriction endonuclease subunit S [Cronobacter dublinensis]MDK1198424.1 restriction endonuclease subunit S [Cronobacter dublinensis]
MTVEKLITDHIDIWSSALQTRSSAGRGSNGKIDLYGIKKLRELILELAVRGKLVPQDPNDEPASELLKRIAAEKAELVKQGKIKTQKPLPEISEDEKPFELPVGWEWVHLPDIYCSISESSRKIKSSEILPEGKYPVIEQSHEFISGYCNNECLLIKLKNPVIVFGDHTRNIKFIDFDFVVGADGVKILSPILICERFFFWQLRSYKLDVRGYARHFKVLNSRLFALPPIAEQVRIVEKVCSLMSLCDQLEQQSLTSLDAHQQLVETLLATLTDSQNAEELAENWARISQHFNTLFTTESSIDALKQTILQLAVMGKLVPQDPNDEPASELLKRIEQEKAQLVKEGKIKKQKPLPPVSDQEKPFELPQGWEWCRLPDLGELSRGKSKHRPRNDPALYVDGKYPLVQTGDVSRSNGTIKTFTALYNELGVKQSRLWPKGTLCITIAANIADSGILEFDACFPDSVVGYSPFISEIPVEYFDFFMRTIKSSLEKYAPSTAQKNINLDILSQVFVPCPPLNEFERVVRKVEALFSLLDLLKSRLQSAQQTQLHLADALTDAALN